MKQNHLILLLLSMLLIFALMHCTSPSEQATLSVDTKQCSGCTNCFPVCEADAIRIIANKAVIDLSKCVKCGKCVEVCPENAIY